jgi:hypothetical protein
MDYTVSVFRSTVTRLVFSHSFRCATSRRCELVQFLDYARKRMAERAVSEADVEFALSQEVRPPRAAHRHGHIIRCGFDTSGSLLEVIVNEHGEVMNVFRPSK